MSNVSRQAMRTRRPQPESAAEAADTAEVEAFLAAWRANDTATAGGGASGGDDGAGGVSESKG